MPNPRFAALLAAGAIATASAAIREEIVRVPAPESTTVAYVKSWDDAAAPKAAAVLFTGGAGAVGLSTKGIPRPGANFLVRSRVLFNTEGIATAVIDAPSHLKEMNDAHRMSARHADEVAAVVRDMRRSFPRIPVYLVGTSRGTVSAAYAGAALGAEIDGVVLTSSLFNATRTGPGISGFDYARLQSRLLFVHHVDDGCFATPYPMAERAASGYALVTVRGGDAPRSGPCDPFSPHGFLGVERPTVRAIVAWMLEGKAPANVP
jgi:hypothetical protein